MKKKSAIICIICGKNKYFDFPQIPLIYADHKQYLSRILLLFIVDDHFIE